MTATDPDCPHAYPTRDTASRALCPVCTADDTTTGPGADCPHKFSNPSDCWICTEDQGPR